MNEPDALVLRHTFAAPRARVFQAWSDPDVLRRWWGAGPDWTCPDVTVDLRPGGSYRLAMTDPGSSEVYVVGGDYLEVVPPERLVYTWRWETPGSPTDDLTTLVTVEFREERPDLTSITLTHQGFADEMQRDLHGEGWRACLANLGSRVLEGSAP